jgi:transcriptional regulator with XRE-family HTH domain
MAKKRKPTADAVEILHRRYYDGRPDRLQALEEARANDEVARKIYELRAKAGLTQRQLAKLVGTTASVICMLEDADYEGHSLSMLRRIAASLDTRVEIRFRPLRRVKRMAEAVGDTRGVRGKAKGSRVDAERARTERLQ